MAGEAPDWRNHIGDECSRQHEQDKGGQYQPEAAKAWIEQKDRGWRAQQLVGQAHNGFDEPIDCSQESQHSGFAGLLPQTPPKTCMTAP